jgi:hypothetical protein
MRERILLGKFTREELDNIMRKASSIENVSERINVLSRHFIGVKYGESTLIGDKDTPEVFVIDLENVDCFTFLDYVEAMRLSGSFSEFEMNLKRVRYRGGVVSFENRNHFFTDWLEYNADFLDEITDAIGGQKVTITTKRLNIKENGTYFLPGIFSAEREIRYIPSDRFDDSVFDKLRTGDYAGIYSNLQGLDVSHVGIIIKEDQDIILRHASSQEEIRKVADQDLIQYVSDKPGIIVFRPKAVSFKL